MSSLYDDALARGRRAGVVLASALLYGCGAGTQPLRLPEGHPAVPGLAGTPRDLEPPAPATDPGEPAAPPPVSAGPAAVPATAPAAERTPPAPQPEPAPPAKVYTCPMHPEVVSNEPGRCPKCEMRLQEAKPAKREDTK